MKTTALPPFHPKSNAESDSWERLEWVRNHLKQRGFWTGFETSTEWELSCVFRSVSPIGIDSVIGGAVGVLAKKDAAEDAYALCLCLSELSCYNNIHSVLQSQCYEVFEHLFPLLPPYRHEQCLHFVATNHVHKTLDFLLLKVAPQAFTKEVLSACLVRENNHAGPRVLEKLDPLELLREHGRDEGYRSLLDSWWAQNLEQGRMPHPTPSRSLSIWVKRLPAVRSVLKAAAMEKAMEEISPCASRRPRL